MADDKPYIVSPLVLTWNDENYYILRSVALLCARIDVRTEDSEQQCMIGIMMEKLIIKIGSYKTKLRAGTQEVQLVVGAQAVDPVAVASSFF